VPFVEDMMQALQIQIDAFWYEILLLAAGLHWGALRAVLLAGYTVELVNRWLTEQAFAPLVAQTAAGLETAFSLTFVAALFVLGVTYALAGRRTRTPAATWSESPGHRGQKCQGAPRRVTEVFLVREQYWQHPYQACYPRRCHCGNGCHPRYAIHPLLSQLPSLHRHYLGITLQEPLQTPSNDTSVQPDSWDGSVF